MRILRICCGVAVLFTSLAYVHLVQHFTADAPFDHRSVWDITALAIGAGLLSFVGAFLLLKRG